MMIICFGDSNTFDYEPRGYFGGRYDHPCPEKLAGKLGGTVLNWGENGREIPTRAIEFPSDTELLVIMLGTNDLLRWASPEAVCNGMERFLKSLDQEKILLIAPPPMKLGVGAQSKSDASGFLSKHYRALAKRLESDLPTPGKWNVPANT